MGGDLRAHHDGARNAPCGPGIDNGRLLLLDPKPVWLRLDRPMKPPNASRLAAVPWASGAPCRSCSCGSRTVPPPKRARRRSSSPFEMVNRRSAGLSGRRCTCALVVWIIVPAACDLAARTPPCRDAHERFSCWLSSSMISHADRRGGPGQRAATTKKAAAEISFSCGLTEGVAGSDTLQ